METGYHSKNGTSPKSQTSREIFLMKASLALLAVGLLLAGCSVMKVDKEMFVYKVKQSDGIITANFVYKDNRFDSLFNTVKAMVWDYESEELYLPVRTGDEVATAEWSNGGFTMTLPPNPHQFLAKMAVIAENDKYINISNKRVNFLGLSFVVSDFDDELVTYLKLDKAVDVVGNFIYVDRKVTVTYSNPEFKWRMTLKPGWNIVAVEDVDIGNMQWRVFNEIGTQQRLQDVLRNSNL
jgi:hypothetical protein